MLAEPPSNYLNRQPIQYHHQHGIVHPNVPQHQQFIPQNIHQQRNLVPRAVVQQPIQVPQFQQRPQQQQQGRPARQNRQNVQKKPVNQSKFRRNPQKQEVAPRPQAVPKNQQQNFQRQPVRQLAPTNLNYNKPQKNNVRVVKQTPPQKQFVPMKQVQVQPMLHIRGIHMVPVKVQREAPSHEYSTLFKQNPAVPLDEPPASYGVPNNNNQQQQGGYQQSHGSSHASSHGSSHGGAAVPISSYGTPAQESGYQQQQGGYQQSQSSSQESGYQQQQGGYQQQQGGYQQSQGSLNQGESASVGNGQGGSEDEGYGYSQPQQGFADGDYSSGAHMFENDQEFVQNVEAALEDGFSYEQQDVGDNSQDGINIDDNLLELIRDVLIEEENINLLGPLGIDGSEGGNQVEQPFPKYGTPEMQPQPDPRSKGSIPPKITGVELDEVIPSIQVAQYLGLSSKYSEAAAAAESASGSSASGASGSGEEFGGYNYRQRF